MVTPWTVEERMEDLAIYWRTFGIYRIIWFLRSANINRLVSPYLLSYYS